ncbi:MAG: YfcC family protein [Spirochaetota bacterium]|nr:YfcC family protein [Spirochaetota bacterium]
MTKFKFKTPHVFTVILFLTLITAILTWFVPAGQYEYTLNTEVGREVPIPGTYNRIEQQPQGLWDVLQAPIKGFYDSKDIALFIFIIGGFLALILHTGALDAGINTTIKHYKGKELLIIPILMFIMALGGTTFGLAEETLSFYPLLIPVMLVLGFDTLTAVAILLVGSNVGVLNSTVNPFATGVASGIAGISIGDGLFLRLGTLMVQLSLLCIIIINYAKKIKKNPSLSLVATMKEENEKFFLNQDDNKVGLEFTTRRKIILVVFGLTFFIMSLGVIPWGSKFGITIFDELALAIRGIPFIGMVLGNLPALGTWWFGEISTLFIISTIICGKINGMHEKELITVFLNGVKDMVPVALIVGLSRGLTIVMDTGGMTATLLSWGEIGLTNLNQGFFIIGAYIFFIPLGFLVPSTSGLATLTMPIFTPLAELANVPPSLIVTAFQSASGMANLITPTSSVVIGGLTLARVDYSIWLKFCGKIWLVLFVTTCMQLLIGLYI